MRLIVLLLFMSAANLTLSDWNDIPMAKFPLRLLHPDLDAIEKYHKSRDDTLDAYIYWPDDIVFHVRREKAHGEEYLRVGNLMNKAFSVLYIPYRKGIFYKDGKFYYMVKKKIIHLQPSYEVYYDYSPAQPSDLCLSIRYKSIDEVMETIEPFYTQHRLYLDAYSENSPSTYLATWNRQTEHFLEYTTWSKDKPTAAADGRLRVLIGKKDENDRWNLRKTIQSTRLVFNQKEKTMTIPIDYNTVSPPYVKDVFGIRMESIGFLEEVQGDRYKLLSAADITSDAAKSLTTHSVSMKNFLDKVKTVEPKVCDLDDDDICLFRPEIVKFQLHGHVLIKYVNYLDDSESVNQECPFGLVNELEGARFKLGGEWTEKICTDNIKIWGGGFVKNSSIQENDVVDICYPHMIKR